MGWFGWGSDSAEKREDAEASLEQEIQKLYGLQKAEGALIARLCKNVYGAPHARLLQDIHTEKSITNKLKMLAELILKYPNSLSGNQELRQLLNDLNRNYGEQKALVTLLRKDEKELPTP